MDNSQKLSMSYVTKEEVGGDGGGLLLTYARLSVPSLMSRKCGEGGD